MTFTDILEYGARLFEVLAVVVLAVGLVWSVTLAVRSWRRERNGRRATKALRASFGWSLLLALEVLIAADLMRTAVVPITVESVAALGLIVLIRTLLSFSLELELGGRPPWRPVSRDRRAR